MGFKGVHEDCGFVWYPYRTKVRNTIIWRYQANGQCEDCGGQVILYKHYRLPRLKENIPILCAKCIYLRRVKGIFIEGGYTWEPFIKNNRIKYRAEIPCRICGKTRPIEYSDYRGRKRKNQSVDVCFKHTGRMGADNYGWKGGRTKLKSGYVKLRIYDDDPFYCMADDYRGAHSGSITEHRYIMAKHLNRVLTDKEIVHHINGIRWDNRIENLELVNAQVHKVIIMYQEENDRLKEKIKILTHVT